MPFDVNLSIASIRILSIVPVLVLACLTGCQEKNSPGNRKGAISPATDAPSNNAPGAIARTRFRPGEGRAAVRPGNG